MELMLAAFVLLYDIRDPDTATAVFDLTKWVVAFENAIKLVCTGSLIVLAFETGGILLKCVSCSLCL